MLTFMGQVESLIVLAGEGREGLGRGIAGYSERTLSSREAASLIQGVVDNRREVLDGLSALAAPDSGGAERVLLAFTNAMRYSLNADQHYLDWVNGSGGVKAADPDNTKARYWKTRFVRAYNRLAGRYGLRDDWTVDDI